MNTGQFYDHTSYPTTGAPGSSAALRAELDQIEAAFNKLPSLTGNAGKLVKISAAGTDLETSSVISENGTDVSMTGNLTVAGGAIGASNAQRHTIPAVTADTFVLRVAVQTLTNKTIDLASNALTGTLAQFNTALTGADFATLAGAETLTNKSIDLTNNTITGTLAQFNAALTGADFATLAGAETLSNKTFTLLANTLTGTKAQFNTACTDDDFVFASSITTPAASGVTFTSGGNIAATNVQAALLELDSEKLSNAAGAVLGANLESIITAGSVGSGSQIPVIAYDAKGRITATSTAALVNTLQTFTVTDSTDIALASAPSSQSNVGSSFSVNIPASGLIRLASFSGRVSFPSQNFANTVFGIRIASTNYWFGQDAVNGATQLIPSLALRASISGTMDLSGSGFVANEASNTNLNAIAEPVIDIINSSVPTGTQTVQLIAGWASGSTHTIKGTVKQTRVTLEVLST